MRIIYWYFQYTLGKPHPPENLYHLFQIPDGDDDDYVLDMFRVIQDSSFYMKVVLFRFHHNKYGHTLVMDISTFLSYY